MVSRILVAYLTVVNFSLVFKSGNGQALPLALWVQSFFETVYELPYTVIRKIDTIVEERKYSTSKWICTEEFATPRRFEEKYPEMMNVLFAYRKQLGLPVTVPLSTKVDHRNGALYSYETCLHVPDHFQIPNASESTRMSPTRNRTPTIKIRPTLRVFSLEFGGCTTGGGTFELKMRELSNRLQNQTLRFDQSELGSRALHFNNIYSSPTNFWNCRNEVWLLAGKTST